MKKKYYKNKNKNFDVDDVLSSVVDMLYLENKINYKKKNNIKLSKEEEFFDLFVIKPSFLLRALDSASKDKD